ncbi:peptidoglycan-binding domain-containing protein [Catellatospora paridis]|uniref:peptidoglycan-binding domain-containing protein n=1 Tax=Catellatospora paridis TaxID=1617086 RepID=UPI001E351055|nr:peptidoglycan-binding domain-containing protein [Catellatospora paridis]
MTETAELVALQTPDGTVPVRRRRRRGARTALLVIGALAAGGAAAAAAVGFGGGDGATPAGNNLPPATAPVTRQTLQDAQTLDGELGFGPTYSAVNRLNGTVTWLPESGAVVSRGKPLYKIDNTPAVLMYGNVPAYRELKSGDEGADVKQLEQNLKALGYSGFTVDDEFTASTAAAVKKWQDKLGIEETGRVEFGRVVFALGQVRVESLEATVSAPAQPGSAVLKYTGTVRVVVVQLDVADQRLAEVGAAVRVELPGGGTADGKVAKAYTVIEAGGQGEEATTKIEAVVSLADQQAVAGFNQAAVDVTFTAAERPDVLTVPVSALVALREGGYGVEVVEGGASRYLAVETGLFSGGRVEVSGAGLAEGMTVGIPR